MRLRDYVCGLFLYGYVYVCFCVVQDSFQSPMPPTLHDKSRSRNLASNIDNAFADYAITFIT